MGNSSVNAAGLASTVALENTAGLDEDLRVFKQRDEARKSAPKRRRIATREAKSLVQYLERDVSHRPEVKAMQEVLRGEGRREALPLCECRRKSRHGWFYETGLVLTGSAIRLNIYAPRRLRASHLKTADTSVMRRVIDESLATACREGVIGRTVTTGPSHARQVTKTAAKLAGGILLLPVTAVVMLLTAPFRKR